MVQYIPTDDGRWVNADFERLARVVNDYDVYLQLMWIPPEHRTRESGEPYMILDTRTNTPVLHAGEFDAPEDILTRLYTSDNIRGNPLEKLEAHNLAMKIMQQQEWQDVRDDMADRANFLFASPLNTVRYNGKKLDHLRRPIL